MGGRRTGGVNMADKVKNQVELALAKMGGNMDVEEDDGIANQHLPGDCG